MLCSWKQCSLIFFYLCYKFSQRNPEDKYTGSPHTNHHTLPHSDRVLKHSHRHLNKFKSDVLETLLCMTRIIGSIRNATVLGQWNREWMFFLQTKYVKVTGIMKVNIKIPSLCCSLCSTRNSLKCHNVKQLSKSEAVHKQSINQLCFI